jgi:cold shock CspA family protein
MRLSGTLRSWNDDRGFGFIAPTHGGAEIFVHISALPRDGTRPTIGEKMSYELGRDRNGKVQAVKVVRQAIGITLQGQSKKLDDPHRSNSLSARLITMLLILALGVYAYKKYDIKITRNPTNVGSEVTPTVESSAAERVTGRPAPGFKPEATSDAGVSSEVTPTVEKIAAERVTGSPAPSFKPETTSVAEKAPTIVYPANFKCDGRTYCSQMSSCAEAKFFLNNCPGTKMDGDGDGIPCENQWCGH